MSLPLEDFYEDILGKAQRGLGFSDQELAAQAAITPEQLQEAQQGQFNETVARQLAQTLKLGADALVACGLKSWQPAVDTLPRNFWQLTSNYQGIMTVNAYVAGHPETGEALIFDSGADAAPILELLKKQNLHPAALLVTHSHGDHIVEIPRLKQELDVPVYAVQGGADCDHRFDWGDTLSLGGFTIECRRTSGHAADGTTFYFQLEDQPIAITGDALFAGSMGGANNHWQEALTYTRNQILSLPEKTLLCPGHGPLTTVANEKHSNPFFSLSL